MLCCSLPRGPVRGGMRVRLRSLRASDACAGCERRVCARLQSVDGRVHDGLRDGLDGPALQRQHPFHTQSVTSLTLYSVTSLTLHTQ